MGFGLVADRDDGVLGGSLGVMACKVAGRVCGGLGGAGGSG